MPTEARCWGWALDHLPVPASATVLGWVEAAWLSHVEAQGGDACGAGCELVDVSDLAEYLAVWMRVAGAGLPR